MDKLSPKLFYVLKNYTKEQFFKDVISGIIVAIIALPLSIALALASGVEPQVGIYTAITAGFIISFLGGSRVQIAGPTAAFATIVAGIVAEKGMEGLVVATIMAGIILIIMGFCRLGNLIKFIPYTITTGFTAGIAVTIFIGQIKDFLGVDTSVYHGQTIDTIGKIKALGAGISAGGISVAALLIGLLSLAILIVWPKINKIIPPSLIAVIAAGAVVYFAGLSNGDVPAVKTIGTSFDIPMGLPKLYHFENFHVSMIRELMPNAFTIAILGSDRIAVILRGIRWYDRKPYPYQYGINRTGSRKYRFCVVWRYSCDRSDCQNSRKCQKRRPFTGCRHGTRNRIMFNASGTYASGKINPDAMYCGNIIYGCL